ncbi:2,3-bisphosphoglycerate-independent phosphoglycerate mutase [bacterium]|nr:2,3-bisphosphoglycerate-independent phosphoglycerate mutase [bacterium]
MNEYQALINRFKNRGPLLNIVMDGYGIGKKDHTNAIFQASTPFIDQLTKSCANTQLIAHGKSVGLPGKSDLGGSEVGHLTIGAGQIIAQGPTLIAKSIEDGSFIKRPVLLEALQNAKQSALHLIGLLSDGSVHSHISHFVTVIEEAVRQGIKKCYVHALLDGRDVGIQTADIYIKQLEKLFYDIRSTHPNWEYTFASGGGRELITMDRDKTWAKVEAGWNTHVLGNSGNVFLSALEAIEYFRKESPGLIDQDCQPFNIINSKGEIPVIKDGDSVISMNFRADRAIELALAFTEEGFKGFPIEKRPDVYFAGMMIYDEDQDIPKNRIMGSPSVENPFGKRILDLGLNQFRLAETQKYAHVTFFFNGGYRNPLDPEKETYFLINSDKVQSFASAPKMKALEIAHKAVEFVKSGKYDFGLINFANADMVGHTGDLLATILAVEMVDAAVKQICEAVSAVNGIAIITADHGNADEMIIFNKKTNSEEMCTKHSINPVPFIIFDPKFDGGYRLKQPGSDVELNLSMISATNFILMGKQVPSDLNDSLFDL